MSRFVHSSTKRLLTVVVVVGSFIPSVNLPVAQAFSGDLELTFGNAGQAQSGGVTQASQSTFRLIRSTSGSKGHEQSGRYLIDDPRTVFKVPDDRQVLVYAEWECTAGMHEFEGHWKNPAGKLVAVSDFKLEVRGKNCSGFFTLLLSETSESGIWTLEARVDGQTTGQHKFQIVSANDPAAPALTACHPRLHSPALLWPRRL